MSGKKSRNKGARFEREIANLISAERTGTRGKPDKEHGDVMHSDFFIQCKRRAKLSIQVWVDDNSVKARNVNKTPVLVIRADHSEPLAVFRLSDVVQMF